jgi:prevent-host-death family protein
MERERGRGRQVSVTELRQNLPAYLASVRTGPAIEVTSHGKVIARIVAGGDPTEEARARLVQARKRAVIGDVVSPVDVAWEAER